MLVVSVWSYILCLIISIANSSIDHSKTPSLYRQFCNQVFPSNRCILVSYWNGQKIQRSINIPSKMFMAMEILRKVEILKKPVVLVMIVVCSILLPCYIGCGGCDLFCHDGCALWAVLRSFALNQCHTLLSTLFPSISFPSSLSSPMIPYLLRISYHSSESCLGFL